MYILYSNNIINWNNIYPMEKLKMYTGRTLTYTFFFHNFYFFNSSLQLINSINFVRIKQQNYYYDDNFNLFLRQHHITYMNTDINKQYAWFVLLDNESVICLHKSLITYMFKGYIRDNTFFPETKINYLSQVNTNNKIIK